MLSFFCKTIFYFLNYSAAQPDAEWPTQELGSLFEGRDGIVGFTCDNDMTWSVDMSHIDVHHNMVLYQKSRYGLQQFRIYDLGKSKIMIQSVEFGVFLCV